MADLEQLVLSVSADTRQMQRALAKLTGDTQKAAADVDAAFGKAPPKIDGVAKSLNKTSFETANLAAQFQDIAVQLQGGTSPFTVALQQGTQISQVLGKQGASGAVGLLGAAFSSLLSPVSLATIGIIALGGFAVQYGAKAIGAVDDLDEKLKEHSELIKSLKDVYGEAGKGVDTVVKEAASVLKTLLGFKTDDLRKEFDSLSGSISKSLSDFRITGIGPAVEENSRKFAAFSDAITAFKATVKDGTPDVLAFRRAVQQLSDASDDKQTRELAKELLDMTEKASGAQLAILSTAKALRGFSAEALAATEQGEAFAKALRALDNTVAPNLSDREKIMKNYEAALVKADGTESRLAAARARNDQLAILSANERKKAGEDAAKSAEANQKRFDSAMQSSAKHNAQVLGATPALGQGASVLADLLEEVRS
ncbi:phage tail length tape measure family protein [Bradyrhizobium sp. 200]|uniref:phage tail length tape measure family protein n=1 Tax=Bradyrhizobium sp. 200 TaxID=2782665 RepID=UPI001FFF5B12|nr:phage tail length tape measure family protein [Bradyrhizobium sp. 200]UPJ53344.1 phage tail length tape measure family protein [Bradyrhizobium sp. 200]